MRPNQPTKTKTIFCVVEGKSSMNAFPISVSEKDFIGDIKNLIKAAKSPMFDRISANLSKRVDALELKATSSSSQVV
ncbi:hypothetical protein BGX23_000404 [Mortierella sp. AD031]|nr:hypothetical protein BGX23_000404 [Mortierella sp. AD031]